MTKVHIQVAKFSPVHFLMLLSLGCTNQMTNVVLLEDYQSRENVKIGTDPNTTVSRNTEQEMKSCKTLKGIPLENCQIDLELLCNTLNDVEHCIQYGSDNSALVWGPY